MCHRHIWTRADGPYLYKNIICPFGKRRGSGTLCEEDDPVPKILHIGGKENCQHCQQDARFEEFMKKREKNIRKTEAKNQGRAEMGNDGTAEREDNDKKLEKVKKHSRCSVS
jgi:hypothetical protein